MDETRYEELKAQAVARHVISMGKLRSLALPQAFVIDNSLPKQGITFISGEPGGAKSWLAYHLMRCVANETEWLGRRYVDEDKTTRGALILNYDNPTSLMAQRFVQMGATDAEPLWFHTINPDDPNAEQIRFPSSDDQASKDHIEQLRMIIAELRPKVTLVDSFRQSTDADENDSKEISCVLRHMKRLLGFGTTLVVIHHSAKGGSSLRGSGEIKASADAHIAVTGDEDPRQAYWEKHRGWPMPMKYKALQFNVKDYGKGAERITRVELEG